MTTHIKAKKYCMALPASHAVFFHWCTKCSVIKLLACLWQPPGRCNTSDHQGLLASTVNVKQQIQRVWYLLLSLAFRLRHCLPPWTPTSDVCRQYDVIPVTTKAFLPKNFCTLSFIFGSLDNTFV